MDMVENLKRRYELNWIRIDQLRRFVELNAITPEDYTYICGEEYESE